MYNCDEYRDEFLAACQIGDYENVIRISKQCDGYVSFRCPDTRESGLHKCARNRNQQSSLQIAKYILKHEPALSSCVSKNNCTPLIIATHFQNEGVVRILLDSIHISDEEILLDFNTNSEIIIGDTEVYVPLSTALHIAILSQNINIITQLFAAGASFWINDNNGESALEMATQSKLKREIMSFVCDPTQCCAGRLIQYWYGQENTLKLLEILLDNGLYVNNQFISGLPLLQVAIHAGDPTIVRCLILHGANIHLMVPHYNFYMDTYLSMDNFDFA